MSSQRMQGVQKGTLGSMHTQGRQGQGHDSAHPDQQWSLRNLPYLHSILMIR